MAICTKFGERVINESLRIHEDCLYRGQIVKVWAILNGQTIEKQYWISDLVADAKNELRDVINSNLNKRKGAK
jgi:hypothetical protein